MGVACPSQFSPGWKIQQVRPWLERTTITRRNVKAKGRRCQEGQNWNLLRSFSVPCVPPELSQRRGSFRILIKLLLHYWALNSLILQVTPFLKNQQTLSFQSHSRFTKKLVVKVQRDPTLSVPFNCFKYLALRLFIRDEFKRINGKYFLRHKIL